jgi:hypothetical protein
MEAEYIALSTAMRSLLPLRTIFGELNVTFSFLPPATSTIHSTIFEDNNAARILTTSDPPLLTRCSRHIYIKYHWFHRHLVPGSIVVEGIDSRPQFGDISTIALVAALFEPLWDHLLGWIPSCEGVLVLRQLSTKHEPADDVGTLLTRRDPTQQVITLNESFS